MDYSIKSENKIPTEDFVRELCRLADRLDAGEVISDTELQPFIARMEEMTNAILELAVDYNDSLPAQFASARQRLRAYMRKSRNEDTTRRMNSSSFEFQPLVDFASTDRELREHQDELEALARAYTRSGEWRLAAQHCFQALDIFDQRRRRVRSEQQQIFFVKEGKHLIARFLDEFLRQKDWRSALEIVERAKARAFSAVLGLTDIRRPDDSSVLAAREHALLEKLKQVTADVWNQKGDEWGGFGQWNELVQLASELEELWTSMSNDAAWTEYVAMRRGTSPTLEKMGHCFSSTTSARPRSALLSYYVDEKTTWLFVLVPGGSGPIAVDTGVSPDHLQVCVQRLLIDFHGWYPANEGQQNKLFSEALSLLPAIRSRSRPQGLPPDPRKLADPSSNYKLTYLDELSERLLPLTVHSLLKDCELLCISPHGPLHSLPLHALRWSDGAYIAEHFGVCYVPSIAVLRHCQGRNERRSAPRDYRPTRGLVACVDMLQEQTTEFEADQNLLSPLLENGAAGTCKILCGAVGLEAATKQRVMRQSERAQVIHLSCHGIFASDNEGNDPLQSALLLSDGCRSRIEAESLWRSRDEIRDCLLTVREIYNLRLKADLVTLAACSTARARVEPGDDLVGLSRAWLYAGTPSLMVALWNVDTMSSHGLLQVYYQQWLKAGEPKWRALQLAQETLIKDTDKPEYRHPYHWAPFILIGDWI